MSGVRYNAFRQKLLAALPTPASGEMSMGFKADGKLWKRDPSGVDTLIEGGGGSTLTLGPAVHANPDMEQLTSGGKIASWNDFWGSGTRSMSTDTSTSVFGTRSMRVDFAVNSAMQMQSDVFPVSPGQLVPFAYWAKGSGIFQPTIQTAPAGVIPDFFNGQTAQVNGPTVTLTSTWTKYNAVMRVPDTHGAARITNIIQGAGSDGSRPAGVLYLDGTESSLTGGNAGPGDLARLTEGITQIPANAWTQQLTTATLSLRGGNVASAGGVVTVAVTGWYRVSANAMYNSGAGTREICRVVTGTNPDAGILISMEGYGGNAALPAFSGADTVFLAAGTQIRMYAYSVGAATSLTEKHLTVEACDPSGSAVLQALGDSGFIDLPFSNNWRNYGSPFDTAQYRKVGNVVYLQGFIAGGTTTSGTVVGTLPPGFRPKAISHVVTTSADGNAARFNIYPDGTILVNAGFSSVWTTLGYTSFVTDTVATGVVTADTGWLPFPAAGGWQNYAGFGPCAYRKIGTKVSFRGLLQRTGAATGAGSAVGTMPAGFRPPFPQIKSARSETPAGVGLASELRIGAAGDIVLQRGDSIGWLSLDDLEYFVD